jgi:hypothetical protein
VVSLFETETFFIAVHTHMEKSFKVTVHDIFSCIIFSDYISTLLMCNFCLSVIFIMLLNTFSVIFLKLIQSEFLKKILKKLAFR